MDDNQRTATDSAGGTVKDFLADLASSAPAPGGGAVAGLQVACGAALVAMVCELTLGRERYRQYEATMRRVRDEANSLRARAWRLAGDDADAYSAVAQAYRLPKATPEQTEARRVAVQAALRRATQVPMATAAEAARVLRLCLEIVADANRNVVSDVAVAGLSASAGLESAAVNAEVNLRLLTDAAFVAEQRAALAHLRDNARADAVEIASATDRIANHAAA